MKKNLFMTAAAIAALLTGCSTDEEIANIETSAKNAIGFNIVSNKAETKATPINPANITDTDFDVFAFNSETKTLFMGNEQGTDGIQIKHNNTSWVYATPSELAYWPTHNLDFYAINPSYESFEQGTHGYFSYNIASNQQTISYNTTDEFSSTTNNYKNIDIMYAVTKNRGKSINNGVVQLNFKHILSQVLFNAKVQYSTMKVTIKNMSIKCFYHSGTFTFPTDGSEPTKNNWTFNSLQHTSGGSGYTVKNDDGTNIIVSSATEKQWITAEANPMLFIPQTLIAWKTSANDPKTKVNADDNNHSYLVIECKIEQNGATVHDGALYIPFGAEWQPGKRYTYTLIFGGGYDDQGEPILTPITFEPTVEPWEDDSVYTPDVPAYTN